MRNVSLIAAIAVLATAATALAGGYPHPEPDALAKAFTGKPVSRGWHGRWRVTGGLDDGVSWRILPTKSKACRAITAGRTSCFIIRPPGHDEDWAGAITLKGARVVLRMTYRPRPNTFGCFKDDAYTYKLTAQKISILKGSSHSCFWEPSAHFPVILKRVS